MDTAVFVHQKEVWQKFELEDTGRAEFPLDTRTDEETFASGMALDRTSQEPVVISKYQWAVPWGHREQIKSPDCRDLLIPVE